MAAALVLATNAQAQTPPASAAPVSSSLPPADSSAALPPSPPLPARDMVIVVGSIRDRVTQRLQLELGALGLRAVVMDGPAQRGDRDAAILGAVGTITVLPELAGVQLRVLDRATGKMHEVETLSGVPMPDAEAALALRAVELLRTRLLKTGAWVSAEPRGPVAARPRTAGTPPVQPRHQPATIRHWVGLNVSPDFAWYSASSPCSQDSQRDGDYVCIRSDDNQYHGNPSVETDARTAARLSTVRVLASYEAVVLDNVSLGARAGWAFRSGPKSDDGHAFLPLHLEARASYWFGERPFQRAGLRPFVFLAGGKAQVDTKSDVAVREEEQCAAYPDALCPAYYGSARVQHNPQGQTVTAWHRAGDWFLGGGGGLMVAFEPKHGLVFDTRLATLMGRSAWVLSPSLGYWVGF